jgi:Zn-dependent protease with chaperone function
VATDFFERQDAARRNTTRLVVLFVLAVLAIVASIDLLLVVALSFAAAEPLARGIDWSLAYDPAVLGLALAGTLLVVGGGSLFKIAQLRRGGRVVAEHLGGRLLNPDSTDPAERQVLNVVEEMAIASGMPAPPVYLLDQEDGINAFAAGFTPGDAVIGITRGSATRLSRDELQGVVAHEFSHILNGDMRLNIRLIGLLHGILIIGMLGYFLLRMTAFSGRRGVRSRQQGNPLPLLAIGLGLTVVGFLGTFFGNVIKAAVSRQREFLADASAVQFTRQPDGIAGALKKIGAAAQGSAIRNPNAPEASHMFFGKATSGLSALFSTHPPLGQRIRRIDPAWDGTFPEATALPPPATAAPAAAGAAGFAGSAAAPAATPDMRRAVAQVGQPDPSHLRYAARLLDGLPAAVTRAAHESYGARAVVYALLLDADEGSRQAQLAHLARAADPGVYAEVLRLVPAIRSVEVKARLPLVEISLPALRALTPAQYRVFRQNVEALVQADERIDLFEWALQRILLHDLEAHHAGTAPPRVRYRTIVSLERQCELLLSVLAHAGHRDEAAAERAFGQARDRLNLPGMRLRRREECRLGALDTALADLEGASPQVTRQILEAAVACIAADRQVTATEAELLRAVSASLGAPMPPLVDAEEGQGAKS